MKTGSPTPTETQTRKTFPLNIYLWPHKYLEILKKYLYLVPGVNYCSTKSLLLFILLIFLSIKIRNKDVTLFFPFEIGCRKFTGTLKFRIENKQMLNFNADGLKVSEWRKLHNVIPPLHCLVIWNWEPNVFHSFHPSEGNFRRGCCLCLHYC